MSRIQPQSNSLLRLILLLLACFLPNCGQPPEPTLRIGSNTWPGYEPLYLARELGYYDTSTIRLVEMTSASDVLNAMQNGSLEGACLTLDECLVLLQDKADLKVVAVLDFSEGGDVVMAKPHIKELADLAGKKIAVEYTAVGAIMLDSVLQAAGLTVEQIEMVDCPINRHVEIYQSVDAVVTFEPIRTKLLNAGAKQLFDSSQIPERIVDVLVVNASALATHPDSVRALLAGLFKATERIESNPEDSYSRIAPRLGIDEKEVAESYLGIRIPDLEENRTLLIGSPSKLNRIANDLSTFMTDRKLLKTKVALSELTAPEFLPPQK